MTLLSFPSPFGKPRAAAAVAAPAPRPRQASDWGQQELADLYRVEALLVQANMGVETERGTTDEGEPWFVFCRPDGEVFVHLCRIDGEYLLDSPGLDAPLRGTDFAGLIDQFVRSAAARAATGNVVQFRKARHDSVVRLHPGIMMAALIWSLYLASDHLMEAAHAAELDLEAADLGGLLGLEPGADADGLVAELDAQLAGNDNAGAPPAEGPRSAEGRGWTGGAASAGLAATLTAIAVTYGLIEQRQIELDLAHKAGAGASGGTALLPADALDLVVADAAAFDGATPLVLAQDPGPIVLDGLALIDLTQMVADGLATVLGKLAAAETAADQPLPAAELGSEPMLSAGARTHAAPETQWQAAAVTPPAAPTIPAPAGSKPVSEAMSLVAMAEKQLGKLTTYTLDGKTISASFDLTAFNFQGSAMPLPEGGDLVIADAGGWIPGVRPLLLGEFDLVLTPTAEGSEDDFGTPSSDHEVPAAGGVGMGLGNYDAFARAFLQDFMSRSDSIEMIKVDHALILVDMTAMDDRFDRYTSRSWVTDDNMVITAVGHYNDFLESGLLFA
ncbi:hypothetical protein [Devosia sp. RR2S18]|uniref:hypothetical protein n=1 Tax=Devosia rhizosphaerae TaxID=3049774 RepID=UPI00253FDB35|nr:hypothetical protein [Devosia sp. RR2S18]WIJ24038.1 hypothetical protein QOV41_13535 [Devosia sp. RR2S18]